jgi:predicted phosphodiesterase
MRATLFADAHIHDAETANLVHRFLDEKSDVYFLGDMFDSPEDASRYDGFLDKYDFIWLKGNHDYWMDLPERAELGDYVLTHGHKLLASWTVEKYFVKYTPAARRVGLFGPAMAFGRALRGSKIEEVVGRANVRLSRIMNTTGRRPIIMGHLHHYIVDGNVIVLPKFPKYAILRGSRLEIRNYLDEI